jgi:hypothetical protein
MNCGHYLFAESQEWKKEIDLSVKLDRLFLLAALYQTLNPISFDFDSPLSFVGRLGSTSFKLQSCHRTFEVLN